VNETPTEVKTQINLHEILDESSQATASSWKNFLNRSSNDQLMRIHHLCVFICAHEASCAQQLCKEITKLILERNEDIYGFPKYPRLYDALRLRSQVGDAIARVESTDELFFLARSQGSREVILHKANIFELLTQGHVS
jgi:hypothetical protein